MTQTTLPETIGADYLRHNLDAILREIAYNGKIFRLKKKGLPAVRIIAENTESATEKTNVELFLETLDKYKHKRRKQHIPQTNREFYDAYMDDYTKRKLTRSVE